MCVFCQFRTSIIVSYSLRTDVYNMQLSNEPAEELAKFLVDTGKGAFALAGFVSGGALFKDSDQGVCTK